ncbi:MAG: uncharacterized protein KVP18_004709 [Porospora cf. gigantea A]|uniref:uncharacterized protein n=1 Tax=Porospora cf. gigantea A TaxID=2853593 RepID=UPI0035596103|nr:MAG: hypothetical protein KVP18_004709 [Porospora cf. gigantea A]
MVNVNLEDTFYADHSTHRESVTYSQNPERSHSLLQGIPSSDRKLMNQGYLEDCGFWSPLRRSVGERKHSDHLQPRPRFRGEFGSTAFAELTFRQLLQLKARTALDQFQILFQILFQKIVFQKILFQKILFQILFQIL